jgi:putative aldouronate transport system substrate-binding protein
MGRIPKGVFMKKVFLILFALFITVAGLSANGNNEKAASESTGNLNKTGFPLVNEPVTLIATAVQHPWSRDWNEMPMFQEYEELSGVKVEFEMIPQSDMKEKTNLMLASADYPDIAFIPGLAGKISEAAADGVVLPLNDLIDEWAPNIQKMFQEQEGTEAACTYPDGNIYGFMAFGNTSHHLRTFSQNYINIKWLENLGLDMPVTLDEFYNVLKAFKEQDPNGNGIKDEIPMAWWTAANGDINQWIWNFGPWGVVDEIMIEDGVARWGFTDEGFKEGTKYFKKLYSEGLMDMESISQTQNQLKAKAQNGDTIMLGLAPSLAPQFLFTDIDKIFYYDNSLGTLRYMKDLVINEKQEISILPPLQGPKGDRLWRENVGGNMINKDRAVIFNVNQYPELTTRWMDAWFDGSEMGQTMLLGAKDVRWFVDEETGHYMNIDPPEGMNKNEHRAQHCPGTGGFNVGYYNRYGELTKPPYPEHLMLEMQTEEYLKYVPEESWAGALMIPTIEETDFLNHYEEEMMTYVWEMMAKFICTDTNVDAEWDGFLAQLDRMKADEILEIKQAQYNRFVGK